MTSERTAYLHIHLPGAVTSVVCARLREKAGRIDLQYGRSYLDRDAAIALDPWELSLERGWRYSRAGDLHGAVRDAGPDAWGRRVQQVRAPGHVLTEVDFLVNAGPDRIGALTVSDSADPHEEEPAPSVPLETLMDAAERVEGGTALPESLATALLRGTSVGGARPKALLDSDEPKILAKFSSSTDHFPVVRTEYAAMRLASACGLQVAGCRLVDVLGRDILLVDRFDRVPAVGGGWHRRMMHSALTVLGLHETESRLASYVDLANQLLRTARDPHESRVELFRRMVFNILVGNTEDHGRNHAVFWDGRHHDLTPAYDLCPDLRAGRTAYQAMTVGRLGRLATLKNALSQADQFSLSAREAQRVTDELVGAVRVGWPEAAEEAGLSVATRQQLERETILGPGCFL